MIYTTKYKSPVGNILLAERDGGLIGLSIDGQKNCFYSGDDEIAECDTPTLNYARVWLDRYFAGDKPEIDEIKLTPHGGEFRQTVWGILRGIPYGKTVTYGEVAREAAARMNRPVMSAQAVGGAVGHNPISIIIPCHRVVGKNGSLTGYDGGIAIKIKLLTAEGADMSKLFAPDKRRHI